MAAAGKHSKQKPNLSLQEETKEELFEDHRWQPLHSLINGNKLNTKQQKQLKRLLKYADDDHDAKAVIGTTVSDEDKQYHINWKSLLAVVSLICCSSFTFGTNLFLIN